MIDVVGYILPFALAVSLSPFPMIAIVLLLLSPHAMMSSVLFVLGWVLGVAGVVTVLTVLAKTIETESAAADTPNPIAGVLRIVLGLLLLVLAYRKLRTWLKQTKSERSSGGGDEVAGAGENAAASAPPAWMSTMTSMVPSRAFTTGLLFAAANPKNLIVGAAAALIIGTAGLNVPEIVGAIALYTLLASFTVLIPVIGFAFFAERMTPVLAAGRDWLVRNNNVIMTLLFVVFGYLLIGEGLSSFS